MRPLRFRVYLGEWYSSARRMLGKQDLGPLRRELLGAWQYASRRLLRPGAVPPLDTSTSSRSAV